VGESLEVRKARWRLKHASIKSCTNAIYWDQRAASRRLLWPVSVSDNELVIPASDDIDMEEVPLTPEEQWAKDLQDREDLCISIAEKSWRDVEAIHGWTERGRFEWSVANSGLGRPTGPWEIYTRLSRDTWLRDVYPLI
jgi:hypothetical protein